MKRWVDVYEDSAQPIIDHRVVLTLEEGLGDVLFNVLRAEATEGRLRPEDPGESASCLGGCCGVFSSGNLSVLPSVL